MAFDQGEADRARLMAAGWLAPASVSVSPSVENGRHAAAAFALSAALCHQQRPEDADSLSARPEPGTRQAALAWGARFALSCESRIRVGMRMRRSSNPGVSESEPRRLHSRGS